MRNLLIFILFLVSSSQLNAQLSRYRTSNSFDPSMDFEVNEYIYDHFEIGGGGHIFILVPGRHAKLRYAPINYQRIKVMGEIRGEIVTAPLAGWNYSVKLGTGFENGVEIHAGFGRSQYVSRALVDSAVYTNNYLYQNSFEFGIRWEGMRRQYDIWAAVPLNMNYAIPVFTVGISFTAGGLWDFKGQKWFLPQRK